MTDLPTPFVSPARRVETTDPTPLARMNRPASKAAVDDLADLYRRTRTAHLADRTAIEEIAARWDERAAQSERIAADLDREAERAVAAFGTELAGRDYRVAAEAQRRYARDDRLQASYLRRET